MSSILLSELLPNRRAIPDPVLSDDPPIKEVTLTWLLWLPIQQYKYSNVKLMS